MVVIKMKQINPKEYPIDDNGDCYMCDGSGVIGYSRKYINMDRETDIDIDFCKCKEEGWKGVHYLKIFNQELLDQYQLERVEGYIPSDMEFEEWITLSKAERTLALKKMKEKLK